MKKFILVLLILLISTKTNASYNSNLSLFCSNDSDNLNIIISTLYLNYYREQKFLDSFGLSHSDINVKGDNFKFNGRREAIQLDFISNNKKSSAKFDLGVSYLNDNSTLTGNIEFSKKIYDNNTLVLSVETNLVDNENSIEENIYYTLASVNLDHERENSFLSGIIGSAFFSNDNRRDFIKTKIGYSIWQKHGIYSYVRTYNYKNSNPFQGFYFDPEYYGRYLVGLQARKKFLTGIVTAHVDVGRQVFDGNNELSYSWYADYKKYITESLVFHIKFESNQFEPKYRYTSLLVNIKYHFDL